LIKYLPIYFIEKDLDFSRFSSLKDDLIREVVRVERMGLALRNRLLPFGVFGEEIFSIA